MILHDMTSYHHVNLHKHPCYIYTLYLNCNRSIITYIALTSWIMININIIVYLSLCFSNFSPAPSPSSSVWFPGQSVEMAGRNHDELPSPNLNGSIPTNPWHSKYHPKTNEFTILVGGFNPFEKYARQIGSSPQVGVKIKIFETTA